MPYRQISINHYNALRCKGSMKIGRYFGSSGYLYAFHIGGSGEMERKKIGCRFLFFWRYRVNHPPLYPWKAIRKNTNNPTNPMVTIVANIIATVETCWYIFSPKIFVRRYFATSNTTFSHILTRISPGSFSYVCFFKFVISNLSESMRLSQLPSRPSNIEEDNALNIQDNFSA